jgi:opacity protein-like surface antigen
MKKIVLLLLILSVSITAFAQNNDVNYDTEDKAYVGINAGYGMFILEDGDGNSLNINTPNAALVVGRRFEIIHLEGTFGMTTAGDDSFTVAGNERTFEYSNMFAMLNWGLDLPINRSGRLVLSPMLGIGVLKSTLTMDGSSEEKSDVSLAWQLGSGIRFMIGENHSLELTALYVGTESPDYDYGNNDVITMKAGAMNVTLGYKYWFY